ncbi:MAG: CoA-binding protein, partial [Bacteroidales bacterium]|nr:CoA-binding protein [Bacteroidales bacterium]
SYKAVNMLTDNGHKVVALGAREGDVNGVSIKTGTPDFKNIHTVTMYLGPQRQKNSFQYIINLKPKRIIFNPGTENDEFMEMAIKNGIEVEQACTLVLLSTDQY